MVRKKILVPLGRPWKDINGVYYALALAKRIQAQVYLLQEEVTDEGEHSLTQWSNEVLLDLINSARQAGLVVSHHIVSTNLKKEIVTLARDENIDLVVFGVDNPDNARLVREVESLATSQIIQVRGKHHASEK